MNNCILLSDESNELNKIKLNLQFFAKEGPGGEKTEPATEKRLNEAREEGKVVKSRELGFAVELIALFLVLKLAMSFVSGMLLNLFELFYNRIPDFAVNKSGFSVRDSSIVANAAMYRILLICLPFFIAGVVVAVAINIIQLKGIKVTLKPLKPKLDKFNPVNGVKRMFSKDSLFELLKSILKIAIIALVAYSVLRNEADQLFALYDIELEQAIILIGNIIINMGLRIAFVYLIIGLVDFIYQKRKFNEDMKMTKQEVKEEMKNAEGSPEVKGQQKRRMREASQRRMMAQLPTADVIITNPTHISVALKYDNTVAKAPIVIAKGEDYLALKIREMAQQYNIEMVEDRPLARMLYATVDIGNEIPPELYKTVAEILAVVYKAKNKV